MIASLQPYTEYKETGLPWVEQVPSHWSMRRNGGLFLQRNETGFPDLPILEVSIKSGVRVRNLENGERKQFMADRRKYKRAQIGDVAYNMMRMWQGAAGRVPVDGLVSPAYVVARPLPGTDSRYFELLFRTPSYQGEVNNVSRGIVSDRNRLYWEDFKQLPSPLPPPEEQAAIVRFLDYANGRLERAIQAKRKVIALLHEEKQAIIQRAVTRGLDPTVTLKPSGIPWLGDIPKHWEVLRSKYIYREVDNRSATGDETHLSMSQKFGLIPSSQIEEKRLVSESYAGAKLCEKGDLVLNRLKAHLGVFALAPERGLVSPDYTVFRPARQLESRYFEAVYRTPACRIELRQRAKGIVQGFWRLYTDDFYDIRLPVPPVDEQIRIIAQLDIDLSGVNTAISRLEREIEFLREYRTRLVADVVTGKLDVRATSRQLPAESLAPESALDPGEMSEPEEAEA
jgi:type I restriction enzyme, S subunit